MDTHLRAIKAAEERWNPSIPKSTHTGCLQIGGQELQCDVLENGTRIIREKNMLTVLGRGKIGGEDRKRAETTNLPIFLTANNLTPYLGGKIKEWATPISYKGPDKKKYIGYDARLLPEICRAYVEAEHDKVLLIGQMRLAATCKAMLCGLATVGIISLVDSATGYELVREKTELQKILEKYISEELREWTKRFPDEFFKQTYRLHGWDYPKIGKNHPQYIGKLINKYVYEKLPIGVLAALKSQNPKNENGRRSYCHHQFLTEDIGNENLKLQINQVVTLMRVSKNIDEFKEHMEKL